MLSFFNNPSPRRYCDGLSRRGFLKAGTLAIGGPPLADFLKLQAHGALAPNRTGKSVIMICLGGGPSHLDTYDMKPDAPAEFRGEFRPIRSNIAGMDMCELFTEQSKIADKFSVV